MDLKTYLRTIDLKKYIQIGKHRITTNGSIILYICPICGRKDHFWINKDRYGSYAACCSGGSLWDWYVEFEGLSKSDARKKVISEFNIPVQKNLNYGPQNYDKFEIMMQCEIDKTIENLEVYCKVMIKNGFFNSKYEKMLMFLERQRTLIAKYYFCMQLKDYFYI